MRADQVRVAARFLGLSQCLLLLPGEAGIGKTWLIERLREQPALDFEVIDDATFELADAQRIGQARRSLVLAYRPEEVPVERMAALLSQVRAPMAVRELQVSPLDSAEVEALAAEHLGRPVGPERASVLHAWTDGVPRLVLELLDHLGADFDPSTVEDLPVPPMARHLTLSRLGGLTPGARAVIDAAAVATWPYTAQAAGPVTEALLGQIAGLSDEELRVAATEAVAGSALFESGDGYRLRHPLAGKAIHAWIPGPQRRYLHLRTAESLAALEDPGHERVALHYLAAGKVDDWRQHLELAAQVAADAGDVGQAVRLLRQVLVHNGLERSELTRIGLKFGAAAQHAAEHDRTVAIMRALLDEQGIPTSTRGELRMNLGLLLTNQAGDGNTGYDEVVRSIPDLAHRPDLQVRAMSALAVPGVSGCAVSDNLYWMRRAEESIGDVHDPVMRLAIEVNLVTTLTCIGEPKAWRRAGMLFDPPTAPGIQLQLRRGCMNLADSATWLGQYRRAKRLVERGQELSETTPDVTYADLGVTALELLLRYFTGDWEGLGERSEQFLHNPEVPRFEAEASFVNGAVNLARGRVDPAVRRLTRIAQSTIGRVSPPVIMTAGAVLSRWRLDKGDSRGAVELIQPGLELMRTKQIWVWAAEVVPAAVEAYARVGELDTAHKLAQDFIDGSRRQEAPSAHAAIPLCEAVLAEAAGELEKAASYYSRAQRRYAQLPRPYDAARAREAVARCLGDMDELTKALSAFTDLGAEGDMARCRTLLRSNGVEPPKRARHRGYGTALSPREAEVVRLAEQGRTNAEIGAALFLSPRTVEQHVAHALRKLGLRSRRDLRRSTS